MSAIGLSHGKGFVISAHAEYGHNHLVFPRQQSNALRALEWEKTPPMKSWISLIGPWLGLFSVAALIALFVIS